MKHNGIFHTAEVAAARFCLAADRAECARARAEKIDRQRKVVPYETARTRTFIGNQITHRLVAGYKVTNYVTLGPLSGPVSNEKPLIPLNCRMLKDTVWWIRNKFSDLPDQRS